MIDTMPMPTIEKLVVVSYATTNPTAQEGGASQIRDTCTSSKLLLGRPVGARLAASLLLVDVVTEDSKRKLLVLILRLPELTWRRQLDIGSINEGLEAAFGLRPVPSTISSQIDSSKRTNS